MATETAPKMSPLIAPAVMLDMGAIEPARLFRLNSFFCKQQEISHQGREGTRRARFRRNDFVSFVIVV
jgi:hypothetical protein